MPAGLRVAGLIKELGAFTSAPSCMPTPNRSTDSPPSHSVTKARPARSVNSTSSSDIESGWRRFRNFRLNCVSGFPYSAISSLPDPRIRDRVQHIGEEVHCYVS